MAIRVPVSEAKGQLTELVRRAEGGEEITLTRHGRPVVRLTPVLPAPDRAGRRDLLNALREAARSKVSAGPAADRSQDFLYGDDGLPL